jgi:hypothetical protein
LRHQFIHGLLKDLEERFGKQPNPESGNDQWREAKQLARIQVVQLFVFRIRDSPKKHSLIEPQQIGSR